MHPALMYCMYISLVSACGWGYNCMLLASIGYNVMIFVMSRSWWWPRQCQCGWLPTLAIKSQTLRRLSKICQGRFRCNAGTRTTFSWQNIALDFLASLKVRSTYKELVRIYLDTTPFCAEFERWCWVHICRRII